MIGAKDDEDERKKDSVKEEEEEEELLLDALAVHNPPKGFTLRQNAWKRACHVADGNEETERDRSRRKEITNSAS